MYIVYGQFYFGGELVDKAVVCLMNDLRMFFSFW